MASNDVRCAVRQLRARPASAAAVILTLAVAVGANSTLFTLVDAALLSPLPIRDADRLVNVYTSRPDGTGYGAVSYPDFLDLRASKEPLAEIFGYSGLMATITGDEESQVVFGELVTANYFSALGVQPALGRGFSEAEGQQRGAHPVVVISDGLWKRRFASDSAIVGRVLPLNGRSYTIVGVAPAGFGGLLVRVMSADLWVPTAMMGALRTDQLDNREERWMFVKGRLREGATVAQAAASAELIAARLRQDHPESNRGRTFRLLSTSDVILHPDADRGVFAAAAATMTAAGLVLLIACANLAGVMLARGLVRQREIAIRFAVGATRWRVVRQLLIESAVLAAAGGLGGLLLARWMAAALAVWRPDLPVPLSLNTAVDVRVASFTLAVTGAALLSFALLPALRTTRTPAAGSPGYSGFSKRRRFLGLRDAVLIPQLALSILLVAAAGFLVRSLSRADAVAPGFDIGRTAFAALNLSMSGYDNARARRFYQDLERMLQTRTPITAAALTSRLPLDLYGNQSTVVTTDDGHRRTTQTADVGRGYFEAMGIPIVNGRGFVPSDEASNAPAVVVVAAATAREYWPGADPIGRQVRLADGAAAQVVGVAADVKVHSLGESPQPLVYQPLRSGHASLLRLVVRSPGDPTTLVSELRQSIRSIDPAVAVFEARTMADNLDVMLYPYRLAASLGSALGLLAILLAGVGLYGVLACGISERLRELAIRMALGAPARALVLAASAGTIRAVAIGAILGVGLALLAGRLLASVLFGISAADPVTLLATTAVLCLVLAAAGAGPIRQVFRTEPVILLRL
jgi:predicted permease